jgi:hypothetical protein
VDAELEEMRRQGVRRSRSRDAGAAPAAPAAPPATHGYASSQSLYSRSLAADQRTLVILIENGGVDLGIPELVDKLLEVVPQSNLLPESARQKVIVFIRDTIQKFTDNLLESAELALNRYSAASPEHYGIVTVLRNGTASYDDLKNKLFSLSREGKLIDLFILTHGSANEIAVNGGITGEKIRQLRAEFGKPLSIRSVYMMNCVGSSLNQAWLDAGAKVSSGSIRNNYLPEPTTFFFWQNWKQGQNFETAVTSAYRKTINVMNDAVRAFFAGLVPGMDSIAQLVDLQKMEFVTDSAPVIQGQRSVSINTDDLSFSQSVWSALATTVLPVSVLRSMGLSGAASTGRVQNSLSASYHSPSMMMARPEDYSRMQNPAAAVPVIAGIAVTDAAQIGLGAAAIIQTQVNASGGSFQLVYDKAQRLLTADARNKMPGAQTSKSKYSRHLMYIGSSSPVIDFAEANIIIEWEGNPYGEIGTPVIRRDLKTSSDWSKSSASVSISKLDRIPLPGTDPRAWPIVYNYEGTFDPVFNGQFEFSGEFEINAFGGLKFNRHEVVSRSLLDFAISGKSEDYVQKGKDVVVPMPTIPQEQIDYLRSTLP